MFLGHDKMEPTFWPKWKQNFLRVVHVLILILKHIAHPLHLNCHPHFPLSTVVHGIYTSLQTFKDPGAIQISPIQPARKQSSSITSYCSDCIFCGPRIATKQYSNAIFLCNSHVLLKQVWSSSCSCNHAPADTSHCCHTAPLLGSCQPRAGLNACAGWAVGGSWHLFLQPLWSIWRPALLSAPRIWYHSQTWLSALCLSFSSNHLAQGAWREATAIFHLRWLH